MFKHNVHSQVARLRNFRRTLFLMNENDKKGEEEREKETGDFGKKKRLLKN